MYNHSKLRGKIREKFGSEIEFAKKIGISQATLSAKLNNKVDLSRTEIINMQSALGISQNEFYSIFFLKE